MRVGLGVLVCALFFLEGRIVLLLLSGVLLAPGAAGGR